jgi:hypothetical protein
MIDMKLMLLGLLGVALPMIGTADLRDVQSLDGAWEIVFDEANEGRAAQWHTQNVFQGLESRREILVPSCWEEIEQDYEGVATYGETFTVSRDWKGKTVGLQFDAVNYIVDVWLNEHGVDRHEGGYGAIEMVSDVIAGWHTWAVTNLPVAAAVPVQVATGWSGNMGATINLGGGQQPPPWLRRFREPAPDRLYRGLSTNPIGA